MDSPTSVFVHPHLSASQPTATVLPTLANLPAMPKESAVTLIPASVPMTLNVSMETAQPMLVSPTAPRQ
jgi:hypothetical protein